MRKIRLSKGLRICTGFAFLFIILMGSALGKELRRLTLDNAASLGTTVSADPKVKYEGNGSVRISTQWPTTICLGEFSGLNVENVKLVYQAKLRCENLKGTAFLEMWCHVGDGQYFSRGMNSVVTGTTNWKTLQTPFFLQAGQKATNVTLNVVINGNGTVWVDNVRLLEEPLR
jgi:hypothetical protein